MPAWVTRLVGFTDDRTGRPHALVTSYAGARVVLDLLTGRLVGAADERAHASVAETARLAGELMIVSGAGSGYLQVSDLDSGRTRWRRWCGDVRSLAIVTLAGRPLAVLTGGSANLQVWSLADDGGQRIGGLRVGAERIGGLSVDAGRIDAGRIGAERVAVLAATELGDDALLAVGTSAGRVSLWGLAMAPGTDDVRAEILGGYAFEAPGLVNVLRFVDWRGRRVLLGAAGRLTRAWEVADLTPLGPVFAEHTGEVNSVVAGRFGDRPVLWSGDDSTVRAWLPETGAPLGEPFRYPYEAAPTCTMAAQIAGRPMLVTGDAAGLVWLWDPDRPYPFRRDVSGAGRRVDGAGDSTGPSRLAVAEVAGRSVVLAGFVGSGVRGFDPVRGAEVDVPLDGCQGAPVLVPGSPPSLARIGPDSIEVWDPATGARVGSTLPCPAGVTGPDGGVTGLSGGVTGPDGGSGPTASGLVDGRLVLLLTAGATLLRCDVGSGTLADPLIGHSGRINALTIAEVDGVPVALTAAEDDTVRLWDLRSGQGGRTVLDGHGGAAYAVTAATVGGRDLAFSAGRNGQVRSIDLTDLVGTDPVGERGAAVVPEPSVVLTATGAVRALVVTRTGPTSWVVAADGATLRWHPLDDVAIPGYTVELGAPVADLVARPDLLVVATRDGLVGYRPGAG